MRCVYVRSQDAEDPLSGLGIGPLDLPSPDPGWVPVQVRAASLNHHDLWSLRGVGLPGEKLPMVLGTDAAGLDPDGRRVLVHAVLTSPGWVGEETLDPGRSLLSEHYPGTLAEQVWVPAGNLVPIDDEMEFTDAACLPTAYLTAYRLLVDAAGVRPGQRVLVQGAGGGVATAAIVLGRAMGAHVTVTSRTRAKREAALAIGAHDAVETGARIEPVDAVIETVGAATWGHSLRVLRPGGVVALAGATSGAMPPAELNRVFFRSLRVVGSTMGTAAQLRDLLGMLRATGVRPVVDSVHDFEESSVRAAFERLASGESFGKVVLDLT